MHLLTLMLLLATTPAEPPPVSPPIAMQEPAKSTDPMTACVVTRLKPFMSPYGIQQAWPVMSSPPPALLHALGTPLSDVGHVADGYAQFLHVDEQARAVYIVEQGGFAGTTKVYGPLPLPRCAATPTTPA